MAQGRVLRQLASIVLAQLALAPFAFAEGKKVAPPVIAPGTEVEFFEKKVRPVLVDHCYKCHSADGGKVKAGLRVDTKEGLLKGGDTGPAVVPGKPEKSLLITAIHYDKDELQMPPKEPLSPQQVADLEAWVKAGAIDPRTGDGKQVVIPAYDYNEWKKFWAFQPVMDPTPTTSVMVTTAIDAFVAKERE